MSTSLIRKAISLFKSDSTSKATQRKYQRAWIQAQSFLGDKHVLAVKIERSSKVDNRVLCRY